MLQNYNSSNVSLSQIDIDSLPWVEKLIRREEVTFGQLSICFRFGFCDETSVTEILKLFSAYRYAGVTLVRICNIATTVNSLADVQLILSDELASSCKKPFRIFSCVRLFR